MARRPGVTSDLDLGGLWVPVITPFTDEDSVDVVGLRRIVDDLFGAGAHGVVALGTTGEPATLEAGEQRLVVETCAEVAAFHDRPIMVGAGSNSTKSTVAAACRWAEVPGVAAVLVVVPYYVRPSEAAV